MIARELASGRRFVLVLQPGEELVAEIADFCRREGVKSAVIPSVFGAFRSVTLIAGEQAPADEEPPLPDRVTVTYTEGIGSGSVGTPAGADAPTVHVHAAVGRKSAAGAAYAGHVVAAIAHYTVEVVVDEVVSPQFVPTPADESFGIPCLRFG